MFKPALAASLALAAAFAAASPASAQEVRRAEVHYGDLDLSRAEGMATLRARVRAAAVTVCGDADRNDIFAKLSIARCRKDAIRGANTQLAAKQANAASLLASR